MTQKEKLFDFKAAAEKAVKDAAAVGVIVCKNCQYWEREKQYATIGHCKIWNVDRNRADYCSEAREREE